MAITDIPLFSALKSRLNWLQARQAVLAENVANADTPGFQAREIETFALPAGTRAGGVRPLDTVRTNAMHIATGPNRADRWGADESGSFEITPSGNSVVLEEQMMKVAETQLDYQMATSLYGRGIGLLRTALGKRA